MKLLYQCNWPHCENTKTKFVCRYNDKCRFCKLEKYHWISASNIDLEIQNCLRVKILRIAQDTRLCAKHHHLHIKNLK